MDTYIIVQARRGKRQGRMSLFGAIEVHYKDVGWTCHFEPLVVEPVET